MLCVVGIECISILLDESFRRSSRLKSIVVPVRLTVHSSPGPTICLLACGGKLLNRGEGGWGVGDELVQWTQSVSYDDQVVSQTSHPSTAFMLSYGGMFNAAAVPNQDHARR